MSLIMDKGNKHILFQDILFEISFLVLYIRVIRKRDNNRNAMYIQILMRLQCYFNNHNGYVLCCSCGDFSCARAVFTTVVTLGRERKTVLNYELYIV